MPDTNDIDAPTRPTRSTPRRPGHELQQRLRDDWEYLARRPEHVAVARSWGVTDTAFHHLDELLTLAGHDVVGDPRCDQVLRRLVEHARSDVLAARIVLQRLVPGMLAQVRTHHRHGDRTDIFEELVGAAWITICEFDPQRRPSCLAAALLAGAEYRAFGRDRRRRPTEARAVDALSFDERPLEVRPSPCDELAELVRQTRADGASDEELALVAGLVEADSPSELARTLGVTARTVRNRRDRITERMRRVALAA